MNSARLLKIIFVLLLLVVSGELGYYVYYQFSIKKDIRDDTSLAATQKTISTLAITEEEKQKGMTICVPVKNDQGYLNTAILEQLKFIPAALTSSTVNNKYQGKIVELNLKGGRRPIEKSKYKNTTRDFLEYQIALKIKQDKEQETLDFYWDSDTLSKIKLLKKEGKEAKLINFSDLQVGDEIEIHETLDLMNKNCVSFQCVLGFDIYKI